MSDEAKNDLVQKRGIPLTPDPTRFVALSFRLGPPERTQNTIQDILELSQNDIRKALNHVRQHFGSSHGDIDNVLIRNYHMIEGYVPEGAMLTHEQQLLIGAYFTKEYSIEAAALCNPSMVLHPNQRGLSEGNKRIILSERGIGEEHISSVCFRTGIVDKHGHIALDERSNGMRLDTGSITGKSRYDNKLFRTKLEQIGVSPEVADTVLQNLGDSFLLDEFREKLHSLVKENFFKNKEKDLQKIKFLETSEYVQSDYTITFNNTPLSHQALIHRAEDEKKGMEDLRWVLFEDDGKKIYHATYTAYDGVNIAPKLISTEDFSTYHITALKGAAAVDKGHALFPKKINGKYAMIGRQDGRNMTIMYSDDLHKWEDYTIMRAPKHTWELTQIGNCGSPIETDAGWLLIYHGVGPMRQYSIGAMILDKDNPEKIIAETKEPILVPSDQERDGYVPNVAYSCGAMKNGNNIVMPYAASDQLYDMATISITGLLKNMTPVDGRDINTFLHDICAVQLADKQAPRKAR